MGEDAAADEALALLREGGVDLSTVVVLPDAATGIALIAVSADGENQIIVAPGANRRLLPDLVDLPTADALIGQLEVPAQTLADVANGFDGFFAVNLAPARDVPDVLRARADLIVVNETEAAFYGESLHASGGMVAVTRGSRQAALYQDGEEIVAMQPHQVDVADSTGAGDAFYSSVDRRPCRRATAGGCVELRLRGGEPGCDPSRGPTFASSAAGRRQFSGK